MIINLARFVLLAAVLWIVGCAAPFATDISDSVEEFPDRPAIRLALENDATFDMGITIRMLSGESESRRDYYLGEIKSGEFRWVDLVGDEVELVLEKKPDFSGLEGQLMPRTLIFDPKRVRVLNVSLALAWEAAR